MAWVPERGDIVWISMAPQAGREQSGRRPALVLSPAVYNGRVGLAICCPITTVAKGYPFEVEIPEGAGVRGVVLADQVRSLDWRARQADRAAELPEETTRAVLQLLGTLLGSP